MNTTDVNYEQFATESLLSVTSGRLLCPFSRLHEDITKLAGYPVFTHQLPRVANEIIPLLLAACPVLATIEVDDGVANEAERTAFIESIWKAHGYTQFVPVPLLKPESEVDPIAEIQERIGKDRVIVVTV